MNAKYQERIKQSEGSLNSKEDVMNQLKRQTRILKPKSESNNDQLYYSSHPCCITLSLFLRSTVVILNNAKLNRVWKMLIMDCSTSGWRACFINYFNSVISSA